MLLVSCYMGVILGYVACDLLPYETVAPVLAVLPVVFVALFFWLPSTPQYLLKCGRPAEAERSLRWYRNHGTDANSEAELCAELDKFVLIARQNAAQPPVRAKEFCECDETRQDINL